jgi:hypothetical protein
MSSVTTRIFIEDDSRLSSSPFPTVPPSVALNFGGYSLGTNSVSARAPYFRVNYPNGDHVSYDRLTVGARGNAVNALV